MNDGHVEGAGLKVLSRRKWYGGAYCGVCGHRGESLVPQCVRWWDPDDGWKVGVLCTGCGEAAAERGPRADDYAVLTGDPPEEQAERIDAMAELGDEDALYAEFSL